MVHSSDELKNEILSFLQLSPSKSLGEVVDKLMEYKSKTIAGIEEVYIIPGRDNGHPVLAFHIRKIGGELERLPILRSELVD